MTNTITFMTANYVARETGYAMHGWGHGDRATNEAFAPIGTYERRLDELLGGIRAAGFDAIDLWSAHLAPEWATDDHVTVATRVLGRHGLRVVSYAAWIGPTNVERACELALAVGTELIGGGIVGDPAQYPPILRKYGVRIGIENHPERTPAQVLATIEAGDGAFGAIVDTGWWGIQGYDPVRALEELAPHLLHVHLKDVLHEGEPHDTCRWGEGIVPIEACVRALRRIGYAGAIAIEHEPETYDPTAQCAEMLAELRSWLA
jgi:sugar phosphate isomerase/epimerase